MIRSDLTRKSNFRITIFFSSVAVCLLFSGLSPVQVKTRGDAIEVTKSRRLLCDYFLDNDNEEIYSVLWYWTPKSRTTFSSLDLRPMDKSGLQLPDLPQGRVNFFRYLKGVKDGKKAWDDDLRGIFKVNVRNITNIFFYLLYVLKNNMKSFLKVSQQQARTFKKVQ